MIAIFGGRRGLFFLEVGFVPPSQVIFTVPEASGPGRSLYADCVACEGNPDDSVALVERRFRRLSGYPLMYDEIEESDAA